MSAFVKQAVSPKMLISAFGTACFAYLLVVGFIFIRGDSVITELESNMVSQKVTFYQQDVAIAVPELNEGDMAAPLHGDVQEHVSGKDLAALTSSASAQLPPAPYEGLTEESSFGLLPVVGKNNLAPFKAYKKPYAYDVKKPIIAIAVMGVGFSGDELDTVFQKLVPQVSLILSPYTDDLDHVQKAAREKGFETWLEIPFETKDFPYVDPGSLGILSNTGLQYNQDHYRRVLATATGYAGLAGYTDSSFSHVESMLNGILSDGFSRGLGFVELNTGKDSMSRDVAMNARAPYVRSTMDTHNKNFSSAFSTLKKDAMKRAQVVGVFSLTPDLLEHFQNEILRSHEEGFEIVPLSALADQL